MVQQIARLACRNLLRFYIILFSCLAFNAVGTVYANDNLQTLLISGMQAPGLDPGVRFGQIYISATNPQDNSFSFFSWLVGPDEESFGTESVWTSTSEGLNLVARVGDTAPGGPAGSVFMKHRHLGWVSGRQGKVGAVVAGISDTDVLGYPSRGIWQQNDHGELDLVFRTGGLLPDTIDEIQFFITWLDSYVGNGQGQIAVVVRLGDIARIHRGSEALYYHDSDNGLEEVAHRGSFVSDSPEAFEFWDFENLSLSGDGRLVFTSFLSDPNGMYAGKESIWSYRQGEQLELIALGGSQAPGLEPGVLYGDFDRFGISGPKQGDSGNLIFGGTLTGLGVDRNNDRALWIDRDEGGPELLVRTGEQVPDSEGDMRFVTFDSERINDHGQFVFRANVQNMPDNTYGMSLWKGFSADDLQRIVREGDIAPGAEPESTFRAFFAGNTNRHGQAAFYGFLEGPDVDEQNDRGIWAEDLQGNIHLIARKGDLLNVSDDPLNSDFRTVQNLWDFSMNDHGQVIINAQFNDGTSGVFLSSITAVPEPTAVALLLT